MHNTNFNPFSSFNITLLKEHMRLGHADRYQMQDNYKKMDQCK